MNTNNVITPKVGDVWVYTKFWDNTCPSTLIVHNTKYQTTNSTPSIGYYCIDDEKGEHHDYTKEELNSLYALVWRDGKRWDGA